MTNHYQNDFMDGASRLDAVINAHGKVTGLADLVIEQQSSEAIRAILKRISSVVESDNYRREVKEIAGALKDSLIKYLGYTELLKVYNHDAEEADSRTLPELLDALNSLVGLENVKAQVNDLISFQKVQSLRRAQGLFSQKGTLHLAFIGNPGTGKTTVARIIGHIYKQIGLLSRGHFVEASRTDLIAGYQGQTALKVKKVIERAKGGVLFIDEAYSITENDHSDSYGRECLTELTKALEDYRDDLVVIVAGYPEPMEHFFQSNPGLRSRFNTFIRFDDYSPEELMDILQKICRDNDYILTEEATHAIELFFTSSAKEKEENFSNGRLARNLYDNLIMNHAKRVAQIVAPDQHDLAHIEIEDVPTEVITTGETGPTCEPEA